MGDHFVLLMGHLLTESTLEDSIESNRWSKQPLGSEEAITTFSRGMKIDVESSPRTLVECRICNDEDEDSKMETPCSCCGSLKYAHRKCVQMWCNKKGDTICEICRQQFMPGYTAPPPLVHYGGIPMALRGNWDISRRELHSSRLLAMVSRDHDFLDNDFEYSVPTSRSLVCCRIVTIIFLVLLVLRHTLPITISGAGEHWLTLFMIILLRTVVILLPIYVIVKAFTAFQSCRHQQGSQNFPLTT